MVYNVSDPFEEMIQREVVEQYAKYWQSYKFVDSQYCKIVVSDYSNIFILASCCAIIAKMVFILPLSVERNVPQLTKRKVI